MPYHYTDQSREQDPHALPDVEVTLQFTWECKKCGFSPWITETYNMKEGRPEVPRGCDCGGAWGSRRERYWYAYGTPGCLWDSDPVGPFDTEQEALKAAREAAGFCEHGVSDEAVCEECPAPELWVIRRPDSHSYVETVAVNDVRAYGWTRDTSKIAAWCSAESAEKVRVEYWPSRSLVVKLDDADARRWGRSA